MPSESLESISKANPVFRKNISREVIHFFRSMTPDEIATRAISRSGGGNSVADDGCGIVDRLCNGARGATSFNNLLYSAYNSRYTDARVNRVLLFSLFGVSDTAAKTLPEYTTLLAFSKNGRAFLSESRKSRSFNIVTKPADAPEDSIQRLLGQAADEFYTLAMGNNTPIDHFVKQSPFYPYPKLRHY
jgi:predicted nucleotidyltransferase